MIHKMRLFLINLLVGNMSYAKNIIFAPNKVIVRPENNYIVYCVFLNGVKIDKSSYNLNNGDEKNE